MSKDNSIVVDENQIEKVTAEDISEKVTESADDANDVSVKKGKSKKLLLILLFVLLAVVVAGVLGFMVSSEKEAAKQAETTVPTEPTVVYETVPQSSITQDQLNKVVYSSQIGEINGKLYATIDVGTEMYEGYYNKAAETPVIPRLPVEAEGYITSFAQYEGYIYYVVTEDDKWGETFSLYKCKTDFTENERILQNSSSIEGAVRVLGSFIIDNGKLFSTPVDFGEEEPRQYQCIDLATNEESEITPADYIKSFGVTGEDAKIDIFNGTVFISDGGWNKDGKAFAYVVKDNQKVPLTDETITDEYCGKYVVGYANDCVYFTEMFNAPVDGANGKLKCYNISTGEVKVLDQRLIGGSANYFQSYAEIVEE